MEVNKVIQGDCLIKLKELEDNSVDSIITDPPYELGFMGKSWDNTGIANNKDMWAECLRVLKPGGHLLAFSGTRTYHRMAVAIEDAGFDIRDQIAWCYGQGFPKSLNVFKHLQKKCKCGNMEVYENRIKQMGKDSEKETEYFLRFMQEADLSQTIGSEKERGEVLQSGLSEQSSHSTVLREESKESSQGGEERILERGGNLQKTEGELQGSDLPEMSERVFTNGEERRIHNATQVSDGSTPEKIIDENGSGASHRPQSEQQQYREPCAFCKQWGTQAIRTHGVGTALKPSIEPICLARKPLAEKTVAENVLKYGTGGINIDESRVESNEDMSGIKAFGSMPENKTDDRGFSRPWMNDKQSILDKQNAAIDKMKNLGRFPANLILGADENGVHEEVRECFPDAKGWSSQKHNNFNPYGGNALNESKTTRDGFHEGYNDSGNASRFFKSILYYPKASKSERNKNTNNYLIIEICVDNMEVAQLQPKVILEKTELWFTELFGKEKMEEYQMDFKSTIKTETKKTTILIILNYSQHLNIKEYIVGAIKTKMESGGNHAVSVENTNEWRTIITDGLMEYLLGVNPVVYPTQLKIRVNANNFHSTVKPIALMEYLIKMVTKPGGIVLDPFAGSGSTLVAANQNGFQYIGIELTEEYIPIIEARLNSPTQDKLL